MSEWKYQTTIIDIGSKAAAGYDTRQFNVPPGSILTCFSSFWTTPATVVTFISPTYQTATPIPTSSVCFRMNASYYQLYVMEFALSERFTIQIQFGAASLTANHYAFTIKYPSIPDVKMQKQKTL